MDALAASGIDFRDVNVMLEEEGIAKFVTSFDRLLNVIAEKRNAASIRASSQSLT